MSSAKKRRRDRALAGVPAASAERKQERGRARPLSPRIALALHLLGSRGALLAGLTLALALRVWNLVRFSRGPLADALILDHRAYDAWAQRIAAGDWLGQGLFWVDPLYSYGLALVYATAGHRWVVVRALQVALGVLNVGLTGLLARRITGSPRVGNLAVFLAALYIPAIHNEVQLEKATLTTSLLNVALLLFLRETPRALLGSGLVLGLASLARGNLLLFIPAGMAALLGTRPDGQTGGMRIARTGRRNAALFGLAAASVVGLLTARNLLVAGEPVLTTANLGQNLYIGQHRKNVDGTYTAPDFARADPEHEEGDFRAEGERRTGRRLDARASSRFWAGEALREMRADAGATVARSLRKLRLVFHEFEVPDNDDVLIAATYSPVLRSPFFWMGQLVPFALLYAVVAFRRSRPARIVVGVILLYAATLVLFFVVGRFRMPIAPGIVALAAAGLAWLCERLRARDWNRAAPASALVLVAAVFTLLDPPWIASARTSSLAVAYNNMGGQRLAAGDVPGAIEAYERAVAIHPAGVVGSMRTLGDTYLKRGDYANAERMMKMVLAHKPGSELGRAALVRLYEAMARDPRHAADPSVARRLNEALRAAGRPGNALPEPGAAPAPGAPGPAAISTPAVGDGADRARRLVEESRLHRAAGRWAEAITAMQEAVRVGPYDEGLRYALGNAMADHARPEAMVAYYESARKDDPKPQTSLYFWAVGLERRGDVDGALARLAEALAVDPAHEMSEHRRCQILERRGDRTGALARCDEAIAIFPDFRAAHETRARILRDLGRAAEAAEAARAAERSDPGTKRRFFYWGRYLLRQGRHEAAVKELELAVAVDPRDAEAAGLLRDARGHLAGKGGDAAAALVPGASPSPPATLETSATLGAAGGLGPGVVEGLARALSQAPAGSPAWIRWSLGDDGARERARRLAEVLARSGWQVRSVESASMPVKPGVYLFAAEERPSPALELLERALRDAGLAPTLALGYRAYYEERVRTQPGFQGFPLAPDQAFVLVIGRTAAGSTGR